MKYLNLLSAALLIGAVACTEEKIESSRDEGSLF